MPSTTITPPALLERLRAEKFTGYARCTFPSSFAIFLFEAGKLTSAVFHAGGRTLSGLDGIAAAFERLASEGGALDAYRLASELAAAVNALLQGDVLYQGQELKLIDSKALLAKLKAQQFNGCLRIYAAGRTALIFYKDGSAIGFFHDGSQQIETSISESQRIAGLPGAKIDVLATRNAHGLSAYDLLEMVNVEKVWEAARLQHQRELEHVARQATEAQERERARRVLELGEDLKEIAAAYLGKLGKNLVDKELTAAGGPAALLDDAGIEAFLTGLDKAARLLAGASKTEEMLRTMRKEVEERRGLLAGGSV